MEPGEVRVRMVEAIGLYNREDVVPGADECDSSFDDALQVLAQGGLPTFAAARPYLAAEAARERAAAAEIVGRAGEANVGPLRSEAYDLLFDRLLQEQHSGVAAAVSAGIGLIWCSGDDAQTALSLIDHPNRNVRCAAAKHIALTTTDAPEDADHRAALERLRRDSDEDVRGWAEFGLDTLTD